MNHSEPTGGGQRREGPTKPGFHASGVLPLRSYASTPGKRFRSDTEAQPGMIPGQVAKGRQGVRELDAVRSGTDRGKGREGRCSSSSIEMLFLPSRSEGQLRCRRARLTSATPYLLSSCTSCPPRNRRISAPCTGRSLSGADRRVTTSQGHKGGDDEPASASFPRGYYGFAAALTLPRQTWEARLGASGCQARTREQTSSDEVPATRQSVPEASLVRLLPQAVRTTAPLG